MPEISRFFGITIAMFFGDHPPPHFHVRYGPQWAMIAIESLAILQGDLSPRVLGLVVEWGRVHRHELLQNWENGRRLQPLRKIAPLE